MTIETFIDMIHSRKIICFGRGRGLLSFLLMLFSNDCINQVEAVIDNNPVLHGSVVSNYNSCINTYGVEYLKKKQIKDYIIVITVRSEEMIRSIKKQLSVIPEVDGIEVVSYGEIYDDWIEKNKTSFVFPDSIRVLSEPCIPKIIHYCWFGQEKIPDENKRWMDSWSKFCSDYEIIEWNDDNYDYTKNRYMEEAYKAGAWAFVSDYVRLEVIHEYGGVYLDTDVELLKPLDDFLYEEAFAACNAEGRISLGLGFGAKSHMALIKEMLSCYDEMEFKPLLKKQDRVLAVPAPDIHTVYFYNTRRWRYTGRTSDIEGMRIFPFPILDGLNVSEEEKKEYVYAVHHYSASWIPKEG